MTKHSFIQMSKLSNVKGRISYITNHARQENLYATYHTTSPAFWSELARESQQEFKRSCSDGKCIEARELIIALPERFTEYHEQLLLENFTETFHNRYGVECVSALHHNKRKTNYHIHLIFSERKPLDDPLIKVASRNIFLDEIGKRVRTKKEITDENGEIRKGCTIIKKGEIYEKHLFTKKDEQFKSKDFLRQVKEVYTDLINRYIPDPEQQLKIFDNNSVYLPTKKIGKNNPRADEIKADNDARQEWNRTADLALISGIEETKILEIKKEEIHEKVKQSIHKSGWLPTLFRNIVSKAKEFLLGLMREQTMPHKPTLEIDIDEFNHMTTLIKRVHRKADEIHHLQNDVLPTLRQQLADTNGLFKSKERKMLEMQIQHTEEEIKEKLEKLPNTLKADGYPDVEAFMRTYREMEAVVIKYKQDLYKWEHNITEEDQPSIQPKKESVRSTLKQLREQGKQRNQPKHKKKSYDRDSR